MFALSREELQAVSDQLKQAMHNHEQWHKDIIRAVVCRLGHDERDVASDAHRQCRFGQWYYGKETRHLREHPAFIAMEVEHKRMHELAASMLQETEFGRTIKPDQYDNFASALDRLRLELMSMMREIDESLYRVDALTGAENRTGMLAALRELQALVRRGVQASTLAMIDIDHFKRVNDSYGHVVGDDVLSGTVHVIRESLRPYDRVFRYGGEEFLLLLPYSTPETACDIVERVRQKLADTAVAAAGATPVHITVSIGVAELDGNLGVEVSIDRADRAMFAAKAAGRNCSLVWKPSLDATMAPEESTAPSS